MSEPTCNSCGKPWAEHSGAELICHEAAELRAENERLQLIVRARTHRENGCICEKCVETECDVAKVIEELRAENEQLKVENAALNKESIEFSLKTMGMTQDAMHEQQRLFEEIRKLQNAIAGCHERIKQQSVRLAAAKARESQVADDVKALRDYIDHVLTCSPMLEPGVRDAVRAAKNYMDELETFREGI